MSKLDRAEVVMPDLRENRPQMPFERVVLRTLIVSASTDSDKRSLRPPMSISVDSYSSQRSCQALQFSTRVKLLARQG